jgi:hypothetical protein
MKRVLVVALILFAGCKQDDDNKVDTEYPVIGESFPSQCSQISRGDTITFTCDFSDNVALGSFSLDVHHNFDHHTHSTEVEVCEMAPVKTPVHPFLFVQSYTIPEQQASYKPVVKIAVPGDIDPGDYHFMIRLTDQEGWQTLKGLSIKII